MAASNTKGVRVEVIKQGATATDLTPTGANITAAKPAVVEVADVTGLAEGDIIEVPNGATGMAGIDGKWFVITNIDAAANTFELLGSDTTGDTYAAGAAPALKAYPKAERQILCLSSFAINREAPETISTATFCDPSATVAGVVSSAGTVDIGGYVATDGVSNDSLGYAEMIEADLDGKQRTFAIYLGTNGAIVFPGTVTGLALDVPLNGAIAWSAQIALGSTPKHLF